MLLSINDYLRLIASALSDEVLPELASSAAKNILETSICALRDLLKRNALLPALIGQVAPKGLSLAEEMIELLRQIAPSSNEARELRIGVVNELAGNPVCPQLAFASLLTLLDSGAKRLIDARENLPISMDRQVSTWLRSVAEWECGYYARFAQLTVPQAAQSTDTIKTLSQEKLLAHLQARLPDRGHIEVLDFGVNPGGFSNETFFFTLKSRSGEAERLVVRKNSPRAFFTHWAHRAREEFEIVRRVFEAGLPVPQPLWLFKDMPDVDGDYYVATRGAGRMVGNLKGASEFISEKLLFGLAEFLAKLHCIELEKFADYMSVGDTPVTIGDTISAAVRKNVEYLFQLWSSCERLPSPGEAFTIDWLRRNVPQNANRPVVVHTDCFVHNFLVTDDVISTVVDWEAAHFGDPAEDLAYIKDQVSALMSWERFMAHYRQAGGPAVDESTFDYYKCLLNFRNYFGTNVGVARIPNGYSDIRMIPLGGEFFPRFMQACIESAR